MFVDAEDGVAERGVAFQRAPDGHPRHPNRVEDVLVVAGLPVGIEELLGNTVDELRLGSEVFEEIGSEAAVCAGIADDCEAWVVTIGRFVKVGLEDVTFGDLPKAIGLQVPKRVLGSCRAGRTEVLEETAEVFLDVREWDQAIFATLECRQRVEKEEWFVRCAFVASSPNVDLGEAVEDLVAS